MAKFDIEKQYQQKNNYPVEVSFFDETNGDKKMNDSPKLKTNTGILSFNHEELKRRVNLRIPSYYINQLFSADNETNKATFENISELSSQGSSTDVIDDITEIKNTEIEVNQTEKFLAAENDDDDEGEQDETNWIFKIRNIISNITKTTVFKFIIKCLLGICLCIYVGFAMYLNNPFKFPSNYNSTYIIDNYVFTNNKGLALLILVTIVIASLFWDNVMRNRSTFITRCFDRVKSRTECSEKMSLIIHWAKLAIAIMLCFTYLFLVVEDYYNFVSLLGLVVFILLSALMSVHPSKIKWYYAIVGALLQFIMGVFVLRFYFGFRLFKFLGDRVEAFLRFTDYGSELVFGEHFRDHYVAFAALPVGLYFAGFTALMYYLGAIQYFIVKVTWVVNSLLQTSPTESMNAICSIFLGQAEAPLLIKPFLATMTVSELFAVMLGGFATVAGGVFATFIGFGVPANHLLIASIMSAPAALTISKIIYPETRVTKATWDSIRNLPRDTAHNVFEAFANGACAMLTPLAVIATNLIVFTAIFEFLNSCVQWMFSIVNIEDFGIIDALHYPFYPIAVLIGAKLEDCSSVAKLIAKKVFVSELFAYRDLGLTMSFRKQILLNNTYALYRNHTLEIPKNIQMIWDERSLLVATYALCGFSNFASVGICISALSALEPKRTKVFASLALKAMIGGNIACFMTASVCGLLYDPRYS